MNKTFIKIAKAIAKSQEQYPRKWSELLPLERNLALMLAKEAVKAIIKPSNDMIIAGKESGWYVRDSDGDHLWRHGNPEETYKLMIKSILDKI